MRVGVYFSPHHQQSEMGAVIPSSRYRDPATRACFLVEFIALSLLYSLPLEIPAVRFICALLGFIVMCHSYDHLPSSMPFFQIPHGLSDLTQRVSPVDDRCHLSGLHEIAEHG